MTVPITNKVMSVADAVTSTMAAVSNTDAVPALATTVPTVAMSAGKRRSRDRHCGGGARKSENSNEFLYPGHRVILDWAGRLSLCDDQM